MHFLGPHGLRPSPLTRRAYGLENSRDEWFPSSSERTGRRGWFPSQMGRFLRRGAGGCPGVPTPSRGNA